MRPPPLLGAGHVRPNLQPPLAIEGDQDLPQIAHENQGGDASSAPPAGDAEMHDPTDFRLIPINLEGLTPVVTATRVDYQLNWEAPAVDLEGYTRMYTALQETREVLDFLQKQNLSQIAGINNAEFKIEQLKKFAAHSIEFSKFLETEIQKIRANAYSAFNEAESSVHQVANGVSALRDQMWGEFQRIGTNSASVTKSMEKTAENFALLQQEVKKIGEGCISAIEQLRNSMEKMKLFKMLTRNKLCRLPPISIDSEYE